MKQETKEMTDQQRCELMAPRLRFYLNAVFGMDNSAGAGDIPRCEVEINTDNDPVLLVDGWLEAKPDWGIVDNAGQVLIPDEPTWFLCELRPIPQTLWEPADVDIKEVGNFRSRGLIKELVKRVAANRLNNAAMCEQDNEQAEAEKEAAE